VKGSQLLFYTFKIKTMKSLRIFPIYFLAVVLFFLSCNGNEEKTNTDKMSSDTATTTTATPEPVAPSTIVTTPQVMMLIKHKVANFAKWQVAYDNHDSVRLASGMHSYVIGRGVADSNMVFVAIKADDTAKAKAFGKSPNLKQAMQKGGVIGAPSASMVTIMYLDTTVTAPMRSMTTFMVKDWDAWTKAFEEGKQERMDNGLTVRAYGHDVDNNNKVTLITAVIDSAKAAAYWNSDMLKKRRAASGVIGVPERFVYRVVKKY
jgi:hypothetical protein